MASCRHTRGLLVNSPLKPWLTLSRTHHHIVVEKPKGFTARKRLLKRQQNDPPPKPAPRAIKSLEDEIHVPNRLERSPTAVLEALVSTVGRDPMAPHPGTLDDPALSKTLNLSNLKRNVVMHFRGRQTARYIASRYPRLFDLEYEPVIEEYSMPNLTKRRHPVNATDEEHLLTKIKKRQTLLAWIQYKTMLKQGKPVSGFATHMLLDLLTLQNSKRRVLKASSDLANVLDTEEMHKVKSERSVAAIVGKSRTLRKKMVDFNTFSLSSKASRVTSEGRWRHKGLAEQLFKRMPKTVWSCNSMLRGRAHYNCSAEALELFDFMVENQVPVFLGGYHAVMKIYADSQTKRQAFQQNPDLVTRSTIKVLKMMAEENVKPTVDTFNIFLRGLFSMKVEVAQLLARRTLNEMKKLNIEPNLTTWTCVLRLFWSVSMLEQIIEHLEKSDNLLVRKAEDRLFFLDAMKLATAYGSNTELPKKIEDLHLRAGFSQLRLDPKNENAYYQTYLKYLLKHTSIHEAMDSLRQRIAVFCLPMYTVRLLIQHISTHNLGYEYLPEIYQGFDPYETAMYRKFFYTYVELSSRAVLHLPLEKQVKLDIGATLWDFYTSVKLLQRSNRISESFTGQGLNRLAVIVKVLLELDDFRNAILLFNDVLDYIPLQPETGMMICEDLGAAAVRLSDFPKAMVMVEVMWNFKFNDSMNRMIELIEAMPKKPEDLENLERMKIRVGYKSTLLQKEG